MQRAMDGLFARAAAAPRTDRTCTSFRTKYAFLAGAAAMGLIACSPADDPGAALSPVSGSSQSGASNGAASDSVTKPQAARFLSQASFGPSMPAIDRMEATGPSAWFLDQLNRPATLHLQGLLTRQARGGEIRGRDFSDSVWTAVVSADDQLRQRMAFALSQILVVGDSGLPNEPLAMAYYADILTNNAFGNYRDILEEVTYSPAMAIWLTYLRNQKANPETGSVPDENYAREIMQLFTIGLVELDAGGSPIAGDIETYTNDDVVGLAKVFTGLSFKSSFFKNDDPSNMHSRLVAYPEFHAPEEKSFLGMTIPANTGPEESIDLALDHLFNHPNTAPFIARQLIQRFVTSNPSADYVRRVAFAFERGAYLLPNGEWVGDDRRGNLAATLAAILFDVEARQDPASAPAAFGKIQEPVLRFTHWARAMAIDSAQASEERLFNDMGRADRLGQHPFRSPSVFNFYRPNYVAPGSQTGAANLVAPELQILNESTSTGYANIMSRFVRDQTPNEESASGDAFRSRYLSEVALADDPQALIDRLDLLLTNGALSADTRARIAAVLGEMRIRENNVADDRLSRVHLAVTMIVTSPDYIVLR